MKEQKPVQESVDATDYMVKCVLNVVRPIVEKNTADMNRISGAVLTRLDAIEKRMVKIECMYDKVVRDAELKKLTDIANEFKRGDITAVKMLHDLGVNLPFGTPIP